MLKNCYVYGNVCGIIKEEMNMIFTLQVTSYDDKAYSILIDGIDYVLPQEWLDRLMVE